MPMDDRWTGLYVLDEQGNPRPERNLLTWGQWFETAERQVALSKFAWGCVSTIFLCLDPSFLCLDPSFHPDPMADPLHYEPVLWETMVFGGKLDREKERYRSREEALKGHHEMVERCKAAEEDPGNRIAMEALNGQEKE